MSVTLTHPFATAGHDVELEDSLLASVEALASLVDLRDGYTGAHSRDVEKLARQVGERLGLSGSELTELAIAARLHDIGKIGVPDGILCKPGPLTPAETTTVRRHSEWGAETLESLPGFAGIAEIVRHHHEHWDGNGYPAGLAGESIPTASRIISVCDAFDAMTSDRPYRRALEVQQAVCLLQAGAGTQFDADVVRVTCDVLGERGIEVSGSEPTTAVRADPPIAERHDVTRPGRLAAAFGRLDTLPALSESRDRLLALLDDEHPSMDDIVVTVESDVALAIAVLRAANALPGPRRGKIAGVPEAARLLSPTGLARLAREIRTFEFFQRIPGWEAPEQFRLHAVATMQAAARITRHLEPEDRDAVMVAALLHDVGKLVLGDAHPSYPVGVHGPAETPEERVWAEQRELGVDHAAVGAVLVRRWGLPARVATAVEHHHVESETRDAAYVRLADLLAHYVQGRPVRPLELERAGRAIGLGAREVCALMFELPLPRPAQRRATDPSPLSRQERRTLQELATGKVYKEIGVALGLAPSTVRSHAHRCYEKIGAADRAQAVLMATDKGWI